MTFLGESVASRAMTGGVEELLSEADRRSTDALAIVRRGEVVFDWGPAKVEPIELMSCTKLVVAVVIGALLGEQALETLDRPFREIDDRWSELPESVTLAALLSHTTGLEPIPAHQVYSADDIVQQASALLYRPQLAGRHAYNNSAINLVGGLARSVSGRALHEFADTELFGRLGWGPWSWQTDSAGNPYCFAGLRARAKDVARLVDLLQHDPAGLLPPGWGAAVVSRRLSCYGQVAWIRACVSDRLLENWSAHGVSPSIIEALSPLLGREFNLEDYFAEVEAALGPSGIGIGDFAAAVSAAGQPRAETTTGETVGRGHDGDGGQFLLLLEGGEYSACRLRALDRRSPRAGPESWSGFPGELSRVLSTG